MNYNSDTVLLWRAKKQLLKVPEMEDTCTIEHSSAEQDEISFNLQTHHEAESADNNEAISTHHVTSQGTPICNVNDESPFFIPQICSHHQLLGTATFSQTPVSWSQTALKLDRYGLLHISTFWICIAKRPEETSVKHSAVHLNGSIPP